VCAPQLKHWRVLLSRPGGPNVAPDSPPHCVLQLLPRGLAEPPQPGRQVSQLLAEVAPGEDVA
jgi:hypothetical protein